MEVIKIKITPENIGQFYIYDERLDTKEFLDDCKELEKKISAFVKGKKTKLTKKYPERYDLTVFTYSQNREPWLINDGCHRIEALRNLFARKKIDHFDAWLIPSNIIGAKTREQALELNAIIKKKLDEVGLPHWVQKFDYELQNGKLITWKNLNLIDTGGKDKTLQYGVNWFLNEDIRLRLRETDNHIYKNKYKI